MVGVVPHTSIHSDVNGYTDAKLWEDNPPIVCTNTAYFAICKQIGMQPWPGVAQHFRDKLGHLMVESEPPKHPKELLNLLDARDAWDAPEGAWGARETSLWRTPKTRSRRGGQRARPGRARARPAPPEPVARLFWSIRTAAGPARCAGRPRRPSGTQVEASKAECPRAIRPGSNSRTAQARRMRAWRCGKRPG